ncbi:hypothetical protein CCR75_002344 [Bremia lactucae]|uniref:RxLR effector protein n=1 Tax=Bremia lactucae TaxID=4779 RepID=A0A976FNP2_BRELC|nr:hypothetical protein CCR75_002344 [Bremia lactucae]
MVKVCLAAVAAFVAISISAFNTSLANIVPVTAEDDDTFAQGRLRANAATNVNSDERGLTRAVDTAIWSLAAKVPFVVPREDAVMTIAASLNKNLEQALRKDTNRLQLLETYVKNHNKHYPSQSTSVYGVLLDRYGEDAIRMAKNNLADSNLKTLKYLES